jgi:hypothetical protein
MHVCQEKLAPRRNPWGPVFLHLPPGLLPYGGDGQAVGPMADAVCPRVHPRLALAAGRKDQKFVPPGQNASAQLA